MTDHAKQLADALRGLLGASFNKWKKFKPTRLLAQRIATANDVLSQTEESKPSNLRQVIAYIGWPKNQERFYLDIIYPGTTQISEEYDYRPLYDNREKESQP